MEVEILEEFDKYLFNAEFKAGVYGPYLECLSTYKNKYVIQYEYDFDLYNLFTGEDNCDEILKFLDPLIRDLFEANEFDLMDISMKDEEYKRTKDNNYGIMDNDKIIDEYCKKKF